MLLALLLVVRLLRLLGLGSGRTRRGHQRRRRGIVGAGRNRFTINILHRREGGNKVEVVVLARQHAARYRRGRSGRRHGAAGRDQPLLGGGRGRAARRGGRVRADRVDVVVVAIVGTVAAAVAGRGVTQQLLM